MTTRDIKIKVTGVQSVAGADDEPEVLELETRGTYSEKNGNRYIKYDVRQNRDSRLVIFLKEPGNFFIVPVRFLLNCCLTAWSGEFFGVWQEGRICGEVGLGIRFLDATEEGGHSLSTEKFAS